MNKCITCGGQEFSKLEGKHALISLVKQGDEIYLDDRDILPLRAEMCNSCNRVDLFVVKDIR